ncbi:hypothetical protein NDI56_00720 [Haloarcula sp. S1CR25-12]|uniref:Uncharacterized protein n=1 Tax=Haloarcula saliterrae TaxID=2950534 RepID=A0ABU2F6M2_9EURY|nr:hypothetical protein [Haloarcula sp. S1CR25-12]MDS0257925.1 hypothetical protein [Haloarcula sp. S1CR25-12]
MFDTHVDTMYVWVAVGAVSVAVFGVVTQLPTSASPDGAAVATTIDEVATSPSGSVTTRELTASDWSLTGRQVGLRSTGGTVHETLLRPAVPATAGRLRTVLDGTPPSAVYGSPAAFRQATEAARTDGVQWRTAPDRMTVRRVVWGGVDVTLVG